jgi:Xaa-Pro aminopeptidase
MDTEASQAAWTDAKARPGPALDEQEIAERIRRFQTELSDLDVDAALLVQKTDVFYLSGTDQDAHVFVPASGDPALFVRRSLHRARLDARLKQVLPLQRFTELPPWIRDLHGALPKRLGLELDILPAKLYLTYQRLFPDTELVDISSAIRRVRMVKSPFELSCIQRAAELADAMLGRVPHFLREVKTELELTIRIESFYRAHNHPGIIPTRGFNRLPVYGQVLSGIRAAEPSNSAGPLGGRGLGPFYSQGPAPEAIEAHRPILVDYAANARGYVADQTRVFSLGPLDKTFLRAFETTLEIQEILAQEGRPGRVTGELYALALQKAEAAGFREGFMGHPDPVPFVGHGVGLELDEWPIIASGSSTVLSANMVIALEPKIVIPGQGAVGIESTFVVTEEGMKKINRFPDEIVVC